MSDMVVITGGSKGIGGALVKKFVAEGYPVCTCSRNEDELLKLKTGLDEKFKDRECHIFSADLSTKEGANDFVKFVKSMATPVEVLINNVGTFIPGKIDTEEEGTLEMMLNINLMSAYNVTRGLVGEMKQRKRGHIFNVESIAGIEAYPGGFSYVVSKFALHGLTGILREELRGSNVKVTSVIPGPTYTSSWYGTDIPEDRFIKAEDIADVVYTTFLMSPGTVVEELVIRPRGGGLK